VGMARETERTSQTIRGRQAHQGGDGFEASAGALRSRTPGAGVDGSFEYRQGARRRIAREPTLFRDGTGQGGADYGALRSSQTTAESAPRTVRAGVSGDPTCSPEGDRSPGHQTQ